MNCTTSGDHANLLNDGFIAGIHPGMEIALNGNDLTHPQLEEFLERVKVMGAFANITVNQKHFMRYDVREKLKKWQDNKLIWGIGVSYDHDISSNNKWFVEFNTFVHQFNNVVIHTITGLLTEEDIRILASAKDLKILILGYKTVGKGIKYVQNEENSSNLDKNMQMLSSKLTSMFNDFEVVSFDNLALDQLNVKKILGEKTFNQFYMGDEGSFTFYVDLVAQTFSLSSMCMKNVPLFMAHPSYASNEKFFGKNDVSMFTPNASIQQMFQYVQEHKKPENWN